ncbi:MAG TPA: hypothetical protein ENI79_05425 [Rhodospirillales bacterium]|nr:hypothetical protein [Rhodospirillales bacterium]
MVDVSQLSEQDGFVRIVGFGGLIAQFLGLAVIFLGVAHEFIVKLLRRRPFVLAFGHGRRGDGQEQRRHK